MSADTTGRRRTMTTRVDPRPRAAELVVAVNGYNRSDVRRILGTMSPSELAAVAVHLARSIDPSVSLAQMGRQDGDMTTGERVGSAVRACADHFDVTVDDVLGRRRIDRIRCARLVTYYVAHVGFCVPITAMGRYLDRGHSAVSHGVALVGHDPDLRAHAASILIQLRRQEAPCQD